MTRFIDLSTSKVNAYGSQYYLFPTKRRKVYTDGSTLPSLTISPEHSRRADSINVGKEKVSKYLFSTSYLMLIVASAGIAFAAETYKITTDHSRIRGIVHYSVIGKYEAKFEKFSGKMIFDPNHLEKSSVDLEIAIDSIKSTHPRLDRLVRSERLLDTQQFPDALFKSSSIVQKENGDYEVKGKLTLHGITRTVTFPFTLDGPRLNAQKQKVINVRGKWPVRRKDFGVTWNPVLDHGGVVVGDHVTIDWNVQAVNR